jgi:ribosomal protein S18 acetylase RimI-like enzyme
MRSTAPTGAPAPSAPAEVRPATAADAAAVAALMREAHAFHAAALPDVFQPPAATVATPEDVLRLLADPGRLLYVAVLAGGVAGYAHAEVQDAPATPYKRASARLYLHAMGVAAAHRGRGAGRALLAAVRDAAAARGLGGVALDVYAFNTAARALYAREGFVPLRERLVARATPAGRSRDAAPS